MSSFKKIIFLGAIFMLSISFVASAHAFGWGMHRTDHETAWDNSITPEQRNAAQKILEKNWNDNAALRQALSDKYAKLNAQLRSDKPDTAEIETLSRDIGDLRGKMLESRIKVRSELEKQGLPSGYYANNGMRGHNGYWHIGGYGNNHGNRHGRMSRGNPFSCWNN